MECDSYLCRGSLLEILSEGHPCSCNGESVKMKRWAVRVVTFSINFL
jgi:hypothetical protein